MKVGNYVKCGHCKWLHFLVEDGNGFDNCFFCSCRAAFMVPGSEDDAPKGCTVQGINIRNVRKPEDANEIKSPESLSPCEQSRSSSRVREEDQEDQEASDQGWSAEEIELARAVWQDQRAKER